MSRSTRVALLLSVSVLVYLNTLVNGFALDDGLYVLRNPAVTHFSVPALFEPNKDSNVFRPLTFAALALNWALGGTHPRGYHAFNLLLHALVTVLLYFVLREMLEPEPQAETLAWVAAILFSVHPIHTDAVASIVGRSELLAAGFLLAAWLFHLRDYAVASLLSFVLALLSKESALVFLPLAFLGDYARGKLKSVYRYSYIVAAALLYIALLWKTKGGRFGQKELPFTENPLAYLPVDLRVLNAVRVAWKYVALQIYPATLSCDYSFNSIPLYATLRHTAPAALAALVTLATWIWTVRSQRNKWALAGTIYIAGFAVTANIFIPTGTIMGERLAYLPSAGFCLLIAVLWASFERYQRRLAWIILALVVMALAARTMLRNRDWQDNFTLFLAAARAVPENASIHDGLAGQYQQRGEWEAALAETQATVQIYPDFPEQLRSQGIPESDFRIVNVAVQLANAGHSDDALAFLNLAIANCPEFSLAWSNRAVLRYQRGETRRAREDAQNALRLDSANPQAQYLLNLLSFPASRPPGR